jgi:hypothetical protein
MTRQGIDREALAWAAGVFDGEGYIGAIERKVPSSGRRVPYLGMVVSQWHDPEVTSRFAAALGFGCLYSRVVRAGTPRESIEYTWKVGGLEQTQAAVAMLWPWLSGPERSQTVRTLEAYHHRREVIGVRAWRRRLRP